MTSDESTGPSLVIRCFNLRPATTTALNHDPRLFAGRYMARIRLFQTHLIGVEIVFGMGNILKIALPIILFVAVHMVDFFAIGQWPKKSKCNSAMNKHGDLLPFTPQLNRQISSPILLWLANMPNERAAAPPFSTHSSFTYPSYPSLIADFVDSLKARDGPPFLKQWQCVMICLHQKLILSGDVPWGADNTAAAHVFRLPTRVNYPPNRTSLLDIFVSFG